MGDGDSLQQNHRAGVASYASICRHPVRGRGEAASEEGMAPVAAQPLIEHHSGRSCTYEKRFRSSRKGCALGIALSPRRIGHRDCCIVPAVVGYEAPRQKGGC
jgi:hypothetical protein